MRFVEGLAIREIGRRTGLHRETIRRALRNSIPPSYSRPARQSKLDSFKDELHGLLREDPVADGVPEREPSHRAVMWTGCASRADGHSTDRPGELGVMARFALPGVG